MEFFSGCFAGVA